MYAWLSRFEVLIAIVAFALLAILTVPRGVQAEVSESRAGTVDSTLEIVQNAIDRYALDHHAWPGGPSRLDPTSSGSLTGLLEQLMHPTNAAGEVSEVADSEFCFGPYLTADSARVMQTLGTDQAGSGAEWYYDPATGRLGHASNRWAQHAAR